MRHIMIVGSSGAGKSTLARELGARLGSRLVHLDRLYWQAGWRVRSRDEMRAGLVAALEGDGCIVNGNNASRFDLRAPRAAAIIWLDYPRVLRLARVLRSVATHYGRTRPDLAEDCPERLDPAFLRYVWTFREHNGPALEALFAAEAGRCRLVRLRSPRELRRWSRALDARPADGRPGTGEAPPVHS